MENKGNIFWAEKEIKLAEATAGEIINTITIVQDVVRQQADSERIVKELEKLAPLVSDFQAFLADLRLLLGDEAKAKQLGIKKEDQLVLMEKRLAGLRRFFDQILPQRETPVIMRGTPLALLFFRASVHLDLAAEMIEDLGLKKIAQLLATVFFDFGRWSNWLLEKKEYIWQPAAKKSEQKQNPSSPIAGDLYSGEK